MCAKRPQARKKMVQERVAAIAQTTWPTLCDAELSALLKLCLAKPSAFPFVTILAVASHSPSLLRCRVHPGDSFFWV